MFYHLLWLLTGFAIGFAVVYSAERTRGLPPHHALVGGAIIGAIWLAIAAVFLPAFTLGEIALPLFATITAFGVFFLVAPNFEYSAPIEGRSLWHVFGAIALATCAFLVYAIVASTGLTNADKLRNTLRHDTSATFDTAVTLLDHAQAHYIDQALANKRAEELTGQELGLTSRYRFDTFRKQLVDGHLYWVAPLINQSFFKWWNNGESPGFAMISASDVNNAKLVLNTHPIAVGNEGFYWWTNIPRSLRTNGYTNVILGESILELRDGDHKPFYVTPLQESKIGYNGHDVTAVILTDAETGEHTEYALDALPTWVDRAFSEALINEQIDDWGKYIGSWWNAWFVGDSTTEPTYGTQLVLTKAGRLAWYTGITGQNANTNATMGFILADVRTGHATFYRGQGLSEVAAKSVLEGAVQEKGYYATPPIPYNVAGTNAYVSILKDDSGNRQGFGIVAYDNRNAYAVESTPEEARRAFVRRLLAKGGTSDSVVSDGAFKTVVVQGIVQRVQIVQGTLYFTLDAKDKASVIFTHPINQNPEAALTERGDAVTVRYVPIDDDSQPVEHLSNQRFNP